MPRNVRLISRGHKTYLKVLGGYFPVIVLLLEVSQLSIQRAFIVQQRDAHVKTSQNALRVSPELIRELVVAMNSAEQSPGIGSEVEEAEQVEESEIKPLGLVIHVIMPRVTTQRLQGRQNSQCNV